MKIICIGRNYQDHISELSNQRPTAPVVFIKPDSAVLPKEQDFYIPDFSSDIHYEVEVLVKIKKVGKHISPEFAHLYFDEVGLGIDFTARDIQQNCKENGLPWEKAKGFDHSAPLSNTWIEKSEIDLQTAEFKLFQNGELRQTGHPKDFIFSIDTVISYVSQFVTLKTGDLIFTGTPAGVGPVQIGDLLRAELNGQALLELKIS